MITSLTAGLTTKSEREFYFLYKTITVISFISFTRFQRKNPDEWSADQLLEKDENIFPSYISITFIRIIAESCQQFKHMLTYPQV